MTATTQYFDTKIVFHKEDFHTLKDILLDRMLLPGYFNPVVQFLSEKSGYDIDVVDDAFRFVKYFERFSKMPFATVLHESNPGSAFWWELYNMYDEDKPRNNCDKMLETIAHLL